MTLLRRHRLSRWVIALWLTSCVAILVFTLAQPELHADERSALAMLVPVYFLALPSSHLALLIIAKLKLALYLHAGFEPGLAAECIYLWTLSVIFGYLQWFVLLPWIVRLSARFAGMPPHTHGRENRK